MNELQQFMYGHQEMRTMNIEGEPWFVAKDVCDVLDIVNSRDAIGRLDDDEKGVVLTDTLGGKQNITTVNESGLYSLILGSRKPEAKQFKRWITHDVIPTIRRTGAYNLPKTMPETLRLLAAEMEDNQRLTLQSAEQQQKIEQDKPKVHFAESVEISKDSILVADLSKLLRQKGIEIGEHRLYKWMREEGYLIKSGSEYNKPTQRSMELGLFEIKTGHRGSSDGTIKLTYTSKVTGKGQIYFINKFLKAA